MAYGNVQVQTSVGGPDPTSDGRFPGPATKKQQNQQQQGGPQGVQGDGRQGPQGNGNTGGNPGGGGPLNQYLNNDPTYRAQMDAYQQALADFRAQSQSSRQQVGQQFQDTRQTMNMQKQQDLPSIQSDYASRGLLGSGLYAKADSDYRINFQDQLQNLIQSRQSNVTNILQALQQFQHQIGSSEHQARLDAIRRRAADLGVG